MVEVPRRSGARKGFFTQCACVLLERAVDLGAVEKALKGFSVAGRRPPARGGWPMGSESVVVATRPDVNGYAIVDFVEHCWPDGMGAPKGPEAEVFGAWALGYFGPCTFPGGLGRAQQHAYTWPQGRDVAGRHCGFVRILTTYVLGATPDTAVLPEDYDPLPELSLVTDLALALMKLKGALCYFNPGGEVLLPAREVSRVLDRQRRGSEPALEAWTNVRMFRPQDVDPRRSWIFMDTVGMGQLDLPDHEVAFPADGPDPSTAAGIVRSMCCYDLEKGGVVGPGDDATDSAGTVWQARIAAESLLPPPRPTVRWFPSDLAEVPPAFLREDPPASPEEGGKRRP